MAGFLAPTERLSKLGAFQIQWRVIKALVYREIRRRVGDLQGGFFAVLIEPMGQVLVWAILRYVITMSPIVNNLNIILFLVAGVIPFSIYSRIATYGLATMEANKALLFYRRVKPIDTILARSVEELGIYSCSAVLLFSAIWLYLGQVVLQNLPQLVIAFLLVTLLGVATGLLTLVGSFYFLNLKQIMPWVNRILYFTSGVIIAPVALPQFVREILVYNPILQCIELARLGLSSDYQVPDGIDLYYPTGFALVYLSLSLWVYTNNERNLLRR